MGTDAGRRLHLQRSIVVMVGVFWIGGNRGRQRGASRRFSRLHWRKRLGDPASFSLVPTRLGSAGLAATRTTSR